MNDIDRLNALYDRVMFPPFVNKVYASDFTNYGYWEKKTKTQQEAGENLMERLLSFIPEKRGRILDVACGKGATTRYLLRYYPDVTGINISPRQLERCRVVAPDAKFMLMDATTLRFDNESFDDVICVEAAFHFETRTRFFEETVRVLRPGGHLVLSDILHCEWCASFFSRENYFPDMAAYINLFKKAGFRDVDVVDATEPCIIQFCKSRLAYFSDLAKSGEFNKLRFQRAKDSLLRRLLRIRQYLLICATKAG